MFDGLRRVLDRRARARSGDRGVVYVGTGESNTAIDSYDGAGLFRTTDGGVNWDYLGPRAQTKRIARIAVDPLNPSAHLRGRRWVRSSAPTRTAGSTAPRTAARTGTGAVPERQHRSVRCCDQSGVARDGLLRDLGARAPSDLSTRVRRGLWNLAQHDFGTTWTRLTTGLPAPSDSVGRIALAIAPLPAVDDLRAHRPRLEPRLHGSRASIAATTAAPPGRVATSTVSPARSAASCWYFGDDRRRSAQSRERVYCARGAADPRRTTAASISPGSPDRSRRPARDLDRSHQDAPDLLGQRRRVLRVDHGGKRGSGTTDLPITQFYAGTIDPSTSDGSMAERRTTTRCRPRRPNPWSAILGGDGFVCHPPHRPGHHVLRVPERSGGTGPQRSVRPAVVDRTHRIDQPATARTGTRRS